MPGHETQGCLFGVENLGMWNVQTLGSARKLQLQCKDIRIYSSEILGKVEEMDEWWRNYLIGGEGHSKGMGFLLKWKSAICNCRTSTWEWKSHKITAWSWTDLKCNGGE